MLTRFYLFKGYFPSASCPTRQRIRTLPSERVQNLTTSHCSPTARASVTSRRVTPAAPYWSPRGCPCPLPTGLIRASRVTLLNYSEVRSFTPNNPQARKPRSLNQPCPPAFSSGPDGADYTPGSHPFRVRLCRHLPTAPELSTGPPGSSHLKLQLSPPPSLLSWFVFLHSVHGETCLPPAFTSSNVSYVKTVTFVCFVLNCAPTWSAAGHTQVCSEFLLDRWMSGHTAYGLRGL